MSRDESKLAQCLRWRDEQTEKAIALLPVPGTEYTAHSTRDMRLAEAHVNAAESWQRIVDRISALLGAR